jgi:hypothetical protein
MENLSMVVGNMPSIRFAGFMKLERFKCVNQPDDYKPSVKELYDVANALAESIAINQSMLEQDNEPSEMVEPRLAKRPEYVKPPQYIIYNEPDHPDLDRFSGQFLQKFFAKLDEVGGESQIRRVLEARMEMVEEIIAGRAVPKEVLYSKDDEGRILISRLNTIG